MEDEVEDSLIPAQQQAITPSAVIPVGSNVPVSYSDTSDIHGHTLRYSNMCTICRHANLMHINIARARDHKPYLQISKEYGVPTEALRKHFDNHYELSDYNRRIVKLQDDTSPEAREIISKIFDGNTDLLEGTSSVLKSKATRLNAVKARIEELTTSMEVGAIEDMDKQEIIMLHRLAQDIEDSILKAYQIIDKKVFPFKKEELSNAVLSYKLETLSKMLDEIKLVLMDFKKRPGCSDIIDDLTNELAKRFNRLEDEVLKSGGIIKPVEQPQDAD